MTLPGQGAVHTVSASQSLPIAASHAIRVINIRKVLYCIVLYCIVLYCIVLYCIVLYCIVLYCIVLYCIVRKGIHHH